MLLDKKTENDLEEILRLEYARDGHLDVANFPRHSADLRALRAMRMAYVLGRDSTSPVNR